MESIDGFGSGFGNIDEAFVDFHFESFTTSFVNVWRLNNSKSAALGRKRNWTGDFSAGADGGVDDLFSALVDDAVVIGF